MSDPSRGLLIARGGNRKRYTTGTVWQHQFWDRFVRHAGEFRNRLVYMHLNPVRKGLAAKRRAGAGRATTISPWIRPLWRPARFRLTMCICLRRAADEKPTTQKPCRGYPLPALPLKNLVRLKPS